MSPLNGIRRSERLFGFVHDIRLVGVALGNDRVLEPDVVDRPWLRQLAGADEATTAALRATMAKGERVAARLLALTVLCMAIARMF